MTDIDTFTTTIPLTVKRTPVEKVVIHFAGDSGDGMQLVGMQFTQSSATLGNDVRTYPDFPAEIRAPAGTLPGVSGFQLSFSDHPIHTPGDHYDVLIAMNPAAMKVSLKNLKQGGILIIDEDKFNDKEYKKANLTQDPLELTELTDHRVVQLPMTSLTLQALETIKMPRSAARKCKNMFALGVVYWLYHRPLEETKEWIAERFKDEPEVKEANLSALRAGYHYAITAGLFAEHFSVKAAALPKGEYRQMTGNQALAWGCVAASIQAKQSLLVCGYPITPASDILHTLAKYGQFGIKVFQAEDEIAAIGAAIGAAYGGSLALTSTSGPGMDLKSEALGLATMTELPLVVVDVQRAGPSTGMPTKVEQSDLLTAMFGRHGECPIPVIAPATPGDCFYTALEAFRLAVKYMTPVIILSDASLANGAEPWKIPDIDTLPDLQPSYADSAEGFLPYRRDPQTLSRPWAIPGTPNLEHRIGGLEKEHETGNISYDPDNHQKMVNLRAAKIQGIENDSLPLEVLGEQTGDVLVIGWGSTYGVIRTVVENLQRDGKAITAAHCRMLNPIHRELGDLIKQFKTVVVVELNTGQLCQLLRARFLVDAQPINKVAGKPFSTCELTEKAVILFEGGSIMSSIETALVPAPQPEAKQSFASDQEVRWCPGCGDYAILASMLKVLPELGIARENTVFISGIGCSSRFPYYINSYGFHTIHGRAPTIATGLKLARPELSVWVITGDGDGLSIGTSHLLHMMRRNINVTILMFNNQIYGLTKGQYSPTSEKGKKTKTTPQGSLDEPFHPIRLALAAGCSFVARAIDVDAKGLQWVLKEAAAHQGTSFVEIYQNCNVFNDGAFAEISDRGLRAQRTVTLAPGKPLVFGPQNEQGLVWNGERFEVLSLNDEADQNNMFVHQADLPLSLVMQLTELNYPDFPVPIGIFRAVSRPCYEEEMHEQVIQAKKKQPNVSLESFLRQGKTWVIKD